MQKETSLNNFEVISRLGQGAFGQVYKVKRKSDNNIYALKKIKTSSIKQKDKLNSLNQIRILASITGQNIIGYKNSFYDQQSNDLCIILEYAEQGDILQKIKENKKKQKIIEQQQIWKAMVHIAKGLRVLHHHNVIHRDLKSANIFITGEGVYKLADLNISKILKESLTKTQTGTPYYCSPEIWKEIPYGSQSDMWSLGCVLYEMASGKPPFAANDIQGLFKKICSGIFPRIPQIYSDQLSNKINSLLKLNPNMRPSANQILKCPIVNKHYKVKQIEQLTPNILMETIKFNDESWKNLNDNLPKPKYQNYQQNENKKQNQNQSIQNVSKSILLRIPKPNKSMRPLSSKSDRKNNQNNQDINLNQQLNLQKNSSEVYTKNKNQQLGDKKRDSILSCGRETGASKLIATPQKPKINKRIILPPLIPTSRSRKNSENIQNYKPPLNNYRISNRNSSKEKPQSISKLKQQPSSISTSTNENKTQIF